MANLMSTEDWRPRSGYSATGSEEMSGTTEKRAPESGIRKVPQYVIRSMRRLPNGEEWDRSAPSANRGIRGEFLHRRPPNPLDHCPGCRCRSLPTPAPQVGTDVVARRHPEAQQSQRPRDVPRETWGWPGRSGSLRGAELVAGRAACWDSSLLAGQSLSRF